MERLAYFTHKFGKFLLDHILFLGIAALLFLVLCGALIPFIKRKYLDLGGPKLRAALLALTIVLVVSGALYLALFLPLLNQPQ